MNSKQTISAVAKIAPPVLLGVVIFSALKWIFSNEDMEKETEIAPAKEKTENRQKNAENTNQKPAFRQILVEIPVKPAIVSIHSAPAPVFPPAVIPPVSIPPVSKVSAFVPASQKIAAQIPPPTKKKLVTRADIATAFHHGARTLTRSAAVSALKNLGFGKTAAYSALSPDGRFSAWLHCAPDGIITWKG
jgi:hypothetical protein